MELIKILINTINRLYSLKIRSVNNNNNDDLLYACASLS